MTKQPLTILGYELTTPKFKGESYDIDRFDCECVEYFFTYLLTEVSLKDRAFRDNNKMINLVSFGSSEDPNLWEGELITAKYGKEQDILDIFEQVETGVKPKDHGVKNTVSFLLEKRTGLLLVEKDSEQVASASMIRKFIHFHKSCIEEYLINFNSQKDPAKMHRHNFLKIGSLPEKSFFEEIDEFATVKDAFYYLDTSSLPATSNEVSNLLYLYNKADKNGVKGTTRVKISFENKIPKGSITGVKAYFNKLFESQFFDGFGVTGSLESGRQRTIELENIQRSFDIKVEYNENGIPSLNDILLGMGNIALRDNPLESKAEIVQYEGVVINEEEDRTI